tara:strand:+ start:556 stop:690 length:135 start_codon:yes stop_codon:yes gene_type:complete
MTIYLVWDTDGDDDPVVFTSAEDALEYYLTDTDYRRVKRVELPV